MYYIWRNGEEYKEMKWSNLKYNKCPQCDKVLQFKEGIGCKCGFRISEAKMQKIITDQKTNDYDKTEENVLCDRCGRSFWGQAWMMHTKKEILCRECIDDSDIF
jgi:hypothetical protein